MKHINKLAYIYSAFIISLLCGLNLQAQETTPAVSTDTLAPIIKQLQSDVKALKKIKITGYMQGQFQMAESKGISTLAGDFDSDTDKKFNIRRGRLKTTYTGKLSEAAIQLDITLEKGVAIKEAYYKITEPLLNTISLQAGLFNRPFGYEIGFSGTAMEAPERARVIQNVFPGETDMGFCLIFQLPKSNPLNAFRIDAGLFNGTNIKADYDNVKDFIGRISYNNTFAGDMLKLGAGISYYNGGTWNFAPNYFEWKDTAFVSTAIDSLSVLKRKFYGADAQATIATPVGATTLRAELVWGSQPGTAKSNKTPIEAAKEVSYMRDFSGGYVYFVQGIMKTRYKVVVKYEWFDPNTAIGEDIIGNKTPAGAGNKTSKADIAYTTLGFGCLYDYDDNVRITAYYDMTTNEKTKLAAYSEDLKDDAFTLRIQYKF